MRWVQWVEPFGPSSEPVYCRVSEEVAKAVAKQTAEKNNHTYETEEQMLVDFMVVHWADFCEAPAET